MSCFLFFLQISTSVTLISMTVPSWLLVRIPMVHTCVNASQDTLAMVFCVQVTGNNNYKTNLMKFVIHRIGSVRP